MTKLSRKLSRQHRGPAIINRPPQEHGMFLSYKEMEKIEANIKNDAVEQSIYKVMVVAAGILWNNWGQLQKKDTRLKTFAALFQQGLKRVGIPDARQKAAEEELKRQTGWSAIREARDLEDGDSRGKEDS